MFALLLVAAETAWSEDLTFRLKNPSGFDRHEVFEVQVPATTDLSQKVLKDQDGNIMDTPAHASDLTVVNGERPAVNSIQAKEREQQFEAWCDERQRKYKETTESTSQTGEPVLRGT